jgi:hypothetical protein
MIRVGTSRERHPTDYIASPLAAHERAVTLALELRMMDFSPQTVAFELSQFHGFAQADAARIVREAAARDLEATEAAKSSSATGARDGRRWLDLSGVLPDRAPATPRVVRH